MIEPEFIWFLYKGIHVSLYFSVSFVRETFLKLHSVVFLQNKPINFLIYLFIFVRDWSLITGRGGLQNGRGGHVKFYPYEKGGRKKF